MTFDSLDKLKKKLLQWDEEGSLNPETKIFEIGRRLKWKKEIIIEGKECGCHD